MQHLSSAVPTTSAAYDIAIVGAGISSAYTLIHCISLLEQQPPDRPLRVVVTEKSGEFWTGIPYGGKSGSTALLISPLKEFISQPVELAQFVNWLNENRQWLFDPQQYQGALASQWLAANADEIAQGRWEDLFIPRYTFGLYLKQRLPELLTKARAKGLLECDLNTVEALDVSRTAGLYQVDVATPTGDRTSLLARKLVLAIGSPPNVSFVPHHPAESDDICYIENMYEPSIDENIQRICQALQASQQRQVLMVGSNAGTLDTLYGINNSAVASELIEKFIVISPNATFPYRINREFTPPVFTPDHTLALVARKSFTAKDIFAAIDHDVAYARSLNINISDIHTELSKVTMDALNLLDATEQKQFVCIYAVEIGKLQRRAGAEYLDVIASLIDRDKLTFIKGKFSKYTATATNEPNCEYIDADSGNIHNLDAPIGVIVNCAGFQDVTRSSSTLIQNLIRREICFPNDSKRGFAIDKNFEASPNCFVMGPLVAGNIDGNFKVWHAESCQRIIGLSQQLAIALLRSEPDPVASSLDRATAGVLVNA